MRRPYALALVAASALACACAAPRSTQLARAADFAGLESELERSPPKDQAALRRVAVESLSAEIKRASSHDDRRFVRSLWACSGSLRDALKERAQQRDALGAEAALLLYELGSWRGPAPGRFRASEDGGWRALAARANGTDLAQRAIDLRDPDERVRSAALDAALHASGKGDVPALLEAARHDPSPLLRSKAVSVLAERGGAEVLAALGDLYLLADEPLRLAVVEAYSAPRLLTEGGARRLERLADTESGLVAVSAAAKLQRVAGLEEKSAARLLTYARSGTTDERRLALRLLEVDHEQTEPTLVELTLDDDPMVAVLAWARLLGRKNTRAEAEDALLELAAETTPDALEARAALAAAGVGAVTPLLVEQSRAPSPELRRTAGYGLLRLGETRALAPLLADEVPGLRRSLACRLLVEPE